MSKIHKVSEAIEHWGYILPYTQMPRSESEYKKLLGFIENLMETSRNKNDERITSLIKLIAENIKKYESQHYHLKPLPPIEMLEFLMDEHGLTQSDLPEIGSQSLVSKILSGERKLTVEHIQQLSNRFGVSPSVFINSEPLD